MAMPLESPISFTNVGRIRWWQRGIFASQTGYVLLALLVLLVVMHFASPYFFTEGNMQNVAKNFSFIAIATLGVTFVIITGGIDLSVGSMMCFSAMITSMVMSGLSTPGMPGASLFVHLAADGKTVVANVPGLILVISILAGLGTALIAGLVNGFCIAVLGLSPFVTTLGMLSIVRGLAYVVSNGRGSFPGGPDAEPVQPAQQVADHDDFFGDGVLGRGQQQHRDPPPDVRQVLRDDVQRDADVKGDHVQAQAAAADDRGEHGAPGQVPARLAGVEADRGRPLARPGQQVEDEQHRA